MFPVLALMLAAGPVETISFTPAAGEVADRFKLAAHTFPAETTPKFELPLSGVTVTSVRFPSAVTSAHPENNTVYAEYYRPTGKTNLPAVVVLDILDGRQTVARGQAVWLAQNNIAAMVVVMAYYGPRRPEGSKLRMLMPDIEHSVAAVTQTALDCRRAAAWLGSRPEVDANRLGIVGTSLGSFVGGVAAAAEPRFKNVCLLLGGGGLVDAFYDHPKAASFRKVNEFLGGSKAKIKPLIAPVDPVTYADALKTRRILLVAASRDDVVPPAATRTLWDATGRPKMVWFDATHVGAAAYVFPAMRAVIAHLSE